MSKAAAAPRRKSSAKAAEEARARMTALMDQLDAWVADIDPEDVAMAKIAIWSEHYSERNAQLIVMQAPEATDVRGYRAWQALGRQVRKGEAGIRILAPAGQSGDVEAKPATEDAPATEAKPGRPRFRLISIFDIAQTDPVVAAVEPVEPVAELIG